jgi:tetratricopeptide (TPR) repeat protein
MEPGDMHWSRERISILIQLARYVNKEDRIDEARKSFEQALALADEARDNSDYGTPLSRLFTFMNARFSYSEFLQDLGEHERVPELMLPAVESARELSESNPRDLQQRAYILHMLKILSISLGELGRIEEATAAFEEAAALGQELTTRDPKSTFYAEGFATTLFHYALFKDRNGDAAAARALLERVPVVLENFLTDVSEIYHHELVAHAYLRLGRRDLAEPHIERLIARNDAKRVFKAYARSLGLWPN